MLTSLLPAVLLLTAAAGPRTNAAKAALTAAPQKPSVYAGVYLSDVSGFDLREGRFQADLDLWLKWSGAAEPPVLRFVNGEIDNKDEQERESDGEWHSIRWRVQGTFRGTFPLQTFPFDRQQLRITLALPDDAAHLAPDLGSSGMAKQFSITGWEYDPYFRAEAGKDVLSSDLGSIKGEGHARTLESVSFVVDLRRPTTSNILKFMLPLAIILAMAFLVFALPASELEVRSAMGVTALLSVVAFHFAMSGSLPDVPYLVAADRLFLASYVLVLGSVLISVIAFRLGEERLAQAVRLDRIGAVVLSLTALVVGGSVITLPMRLEREAREASELRERPPAPPPPVVSARDELRVAIPTLASLSGGGMGQLLRRGLTLNDADEVLRPHLAAAIPSMTDESVRLLPDGGMLVRWRLRPGLRWSDGAPLTALDLAYSLGLVTDPDRLGVTAVDERTLEIRYGRRLAEALTDFPLYPEHSAREVHADGGMEAIRQRNQTNPLPGDGPYRVASFKPGEELVLERNPGFAGIPPPIARIRARVIPTERLAEAFRSGEVDFVPVLPPAAVASVGQVAVVTRALDETLLLLHPDLSVPALANPDVRHALLQALDRQAIADAYVGGHGRVARTFRPSDASDFAADALEIPYAPAEAKKRLKELGGLPPLKLFCADAAAGSGMAQARELVLQQLQAAGLAVELVSVPSSKAQDSMQRGGHGGLLLHTRRDKRPVRFWNLPTALGQALDTRTPLPHFPPEVIDLNHQLETSLFPERRRLLSMRLQRAFAQTLPVLPLAFGTQISAQSKTLHGFGPGDSGSVWWNVETWTLDK
ncbi:MAG TPA: ABC transporter substrate-binding protein [Myxococcaceae bacterium]